MTDDSFVPLPVRPAATVMLVRDDRQRYRGLPDATARRNGIRRRDSGVSRRRRRRPRPQRRHRLGRAAAVVVGGAVRHRHRAGRGAGVRRRPRNLRGMRRAVRRPGRRPERHRQRRIGLPRIPSGAGRPDAVVRRLPAPGKPGAASRSAAAVGELGDARSRAHPPLRHLLLRRSAAGRAACRRRQHRVRPCASGPRRRPPSPNSKPAVAFCCRRPGRSWTR